jgi:hypothetical protein
MNKDKNVLEITDIVSHIKSKSKSLSEIELQQDYNYFKAQEVIKIMLDCGLISLLEFNKLSQLNRETFSPLWMEIMPEIS